MAQLDNTDLELRAVEEPAISAGKETEGLSFPEVLILLAKRKSFVLKFASVAVGVTIVISLLLPTTYTANAKIMPPQQNQSISTTAILSQLGPLAALAGQGLGLRNASDIYVTMLHSETVANRLVDQFSLRSVYGKRLIVDARHHLEDLTEISASKDGVISISVEDRQSFWFSKASASNASRQRAADLANGYVLELEELTKTLAVTEAGKRRKFFDRETKMASDDLANAESELKKTQERTGLILLDPQSRAMIESVSALRARVAAQEVIVQSMQTFAADQNPDLVRALKELAALKEQLDRLEGGGGKRSFADVPIENIPTAGLEYYRKLRDVKYRETLFELLAKQYEAAKIDEARDAMIIRRLDVAAPPEKKTGPHRLIIVLVGTVLGMLLAVLAVFCREAWEQAHDKPQFAARLQLFRFYARGTNSSGRGLSGT
jgi:LPS O-antigen subunit length determinant protein (WzzB/FepE family)